MRRILRLGLALSLVAVGLLVPTGAHADHGHEDDDVRVVGRCTGGAEAELRVRARDHGGLRVEISLRSRRPARPWTVVVIHERRLAYRGRLGSRRASARASLRLAVPDLPGRDSVVVRARKAAAESCTAVAAVVGR